MNTETLKNKIEEWISPLLNEKNLFLVEVRISMGKKIEVYADSDEGILIEDCAFLSRFLENKLDGSGLVPANYILEVSSPGMTNSLKVPRQFQKRIGRKLDVVKLNGEKIEALLTAADNVGINLKEVPIEVKLKKNKKEVEAVPNLKEYALKYTEIKKAVLVLDF